jgi:DEAD/DEAH box helicase domain-containing protein
VLAPHLAAAAAEVPLSDPELTEWFGSGARTIVDGLVADGLLRARPTGWYWTSPDRASDLADLRGGGHTVRVVEADTGRLLGTVGAGQADLLVHSGAVYVHQGATYVVDDLDLDQQVAIVQPEIVDYTTTAREVSDVRIIEAQRTCGWGPIAVSFGRVEVTAQVVAFARRRLATGQLLGIEPLDLPERTLETTGVWVTVPDAELTAAGIDDDAVGGAAHAAEHAAIGLLPLFATCDRWDIGGISTPLHPDTGMCTIIVYDGHPGGAGFAERGFDVAVQWLEATRAAIAACECSHGCPACVQSPKCGNGNEPLDKRGAIALLARCLRHASPEQVLTPDRPATSR